MLPISKLSSLPPVLPNPIPMTKWLFHSEICLNLCFPLSSAQRLILNHGLTAGEFSILISGQSCFLATGTLSPQNTACVYLPTSPVSSAWSPLSLAYSHFLTNIDSFLVRQARLGFLTFQPGTPLLSLCDTVLSPVRSSHSVLCRYISFSVFTTRLLPGYRDFSHLDCCHTWHRTPNLR